MAEDIDGKDIEWGGGLPVLFDESGAEHQVGWYVYSNGTKKPVYQKSVDFGALPNNTMKYVAHGITNIDYVIYIGAVAAYQHIQFLSLSSAHPTELNSNIFIDIDSESVRIYTKANKSEFIGFINIQYTKTTDVAE